MAPSNTKTNFKSFEVQARLLRAIVAAHPEVKWNYKGKRLPHFCPFLSLSLLSSFSLDIASQFAAPSGGPPYLDRATS